MNIFLFDERGGNGFAASAARDGADLPGGPAAWRPHGSFDTAAPRLPQDVIGIGGTDRIISAVQATGSFITTKPRPCTRGST